MAGAIIACPRQVKIPRQLPPQVVRSPFVSGRLRIQIEKMVLVGNVTVMDSVINRTVAVIAFQVHI